MSFTFLPFVGKLIARLMLALFCSIEREHEPASVADCWKEQTYSIREEPKCSNPRDHKRWPLCHKAARDTASRRRVWGPECPVHGPNARVRFDSVPSPMNDPQITMSGHWHNSNWCNRSSCDETVYFGCTGPGDFPPGDLGNEVR
jgi:hypothetical protein